MILTKHVYRSKDAALTDALAHGYGIEVSYRLFGVRRCQARLVGRRTYVLARVSWFKSEYKWKRES